MVAGRTGMGHTVRVNDGRLMLLDTAALYFRAFYGVPDSVRAPDGTPVNAVRGLLDIIARLVTDWHGQGSVHLPGIRVGRRAGRLVFTAAPNNILPDDPTRKNSPRT